MLKKGLDFSLWIDFLEREFIEDSLKRLVAERTVNGATSNPAIFKNAILSSEAYKDQIASLRGKKPKEIYEELAVYDIKRAADVLQELYERGEEGFVSLEVDPSLASDAEGTVKEALSLYERVGRKNLMIKVPLTEAGCEAVEELTGRGINVNATLIFDPEMAKRGIEAFRRGISKNPRSKGVMSIFVSRFDRKLDETLKKEGIEPGKTGIYNAAKIYSMIQEAEIDNLKALFASTGVKGNEYPKDYYISSLVADRSINTAPLETIEAFLKEGDATAKLPLSDETIEEHLQRVDRVVDLKRVYSQLLEEGLEAFEIAFEEILKALE